jgi:hypothetical protein
MSVFEFVEEIQRNVLIEGKGFTFLEDVNAGPLRRMVTCPKFWC